jgi:predicted nucleic acid-binding protein
MSYLLDTCILSKLRKIRTNPNSKLQTWISKHSESDYFINVLTLGEIQKGITRLKSDNEVMKAILEEWLDNELIPRFKGRILPIDAQTAYIWGNLCGNNKTLPVIDSLLAASAIQYHLTLVTDNIKDFAPTGVRLLNPMD